MSYSEEYQAMIGGRGGGADTATLDRPDTDVRVTTDEPSSGDLDDWYTLETKPWTCSSCGTMLRHAAVETDKAGHTVVVWPSKDDPSLLRIARSADEEGETPKIVTYERSMGPCVSFYALDREGVVV